MWTISNSPARLPCVAIVAACVALGSVALSCRPRVARTAPDAPRPTLTTSEKKPPTVDSSQQRTPVELKSVVVRPFDRTLEKLAGAEFLRRATDPLVIEVQTQKPLGDLRRTSSPVIILNGEKFPDTWAIGADKLVAFLPDRRQIKDINTVAVAWVGNEEMTITRSPLTFRSQDVKR